MKPIITLIAACLVFPATLLAQNPLDILPLSGRNERFHSYLLEEGDVLWEARRDSVEAALMSAQALMERQAKLRENYRMLLGDLPTKTPLNAVEGDTIQQDGYYIQKVHFQSRANFHVTGHFYIPSTGSGPFPTVLIMCGHYPSAKAAGLLQQLSASFALNGIAAFIVDPFSQAERYQIKNPSTGNLQFIGQSGTSAHSRLDVGSVLTGSSVVAQALWDNHRAMDYLYSRTDVVDTTRVGCTGSSGGGAQATYLMAFDERVKVAAINSLLMNEETLFKTIGPQTASQNLAYEGAYSIDHPDYITMFAPKPFLLLAGTQDFFDINGTRETRDEAIQVYATLGESESFRYFEEDAEHGYLQPRREEAVRWFKKWFLNDDAPVSESDQIEVELPSALNVTDAGQVILEFADEKNITDFNVALANSLATDRSNFWTQNTTDSCLNKVRELIRLEDYQTVMVADSGTIDRDGYTITKLRINSGNHVPVPGLLFVPDNLTAKAPAVVYVDGRGKLMDAGEGGVLEHFFVDSGKIVLTIDVRGFGETLDNPAKNETKHGNREHRNSVISNYIGKTLIGQRVEDIMKALDVITAHPDVDASDVTLIGIDRAGSAVIHAAALDDRVSHTIIRASFESWVPMVGMPTELHNMTHVVPFALEYYDLPNLVATLPANSVEYFDDPYEVITSVRNLYTTSDQGILEQNFPNPFTDQTVFAYQLRRAGEVRLTIYDQQGRLIRNLPQGRQAEGTYQVAVVANNLPAGTYHTQLWVDGLLAGSRKMVVR